MEHLITSFNSATSEVRMFLTSHPTHNYALILFSFPCVLQFFFKHRLANELTISLLINEFTFTQTRFPGEDADHQMNKLHLVHEIVTFLLGIVFFCNGGWMLLFETVGIVRALAMCASLFLIWRKAKQLCKVKRTEAFLKVSSLRSKTRTDLKNVIDICAICYQDLQTALVKETVCKHLFHESCLCKWASLSDKCPMCHRNAFAS